MSIRRVIFRFWLHTIDALVTRLDTMLGLPAADQGSWQGFGPGQDSVPLDGESEAE